MASKDEAAANGSRPPDRDEKVKIDLPPDVALHALLNIPPEPEKAPAKPAK